MVRRQNIALLLGLIGVVLNGQPLAASPESSLGKNTPIAQFFASYCTECHGQEKQKGDLRLDELNHPDAGADSLEKWRIISEQIRFLDMPPEDSVQPAAGERHHILGQIEQLLARPQQAGNTDDPRLLLPEFGNYVSHAALFDRPAGMVMPASPSLWRLRPESYEGLVAQLREGEAAFPQPFPIRRDLAVRDYSALAIIDEPAVDLLFRNADLIVREQAEGPNFGEIFSVLRSEEPPDAEAMQAAVRLEFRLALQRNPTPDELEKFLRLWRRNLASSGHPVGSRATLAAVLMLPEVLFRYELGTGVPDGHGRVRLSGPEVARALSLSLRDRVDPGLLRAAEDGRLSTRPQVEGAVRSLLAAPDEENPRLLQFFREFFDYEKAIDVFKDPPGRGVHDAAALVGDLEALISHILSSDRDVLRRLLTTDEAFVNWRAGPPGGKPVPAVSGLGYATVYGLPPDWKWTSDQPVPLTAGHRSGVLTHPAWLVAHSLNTENDPVRRGKWIRTRLLGGTIPDVPIGVEAKVPEDPDKTLRARLNAVTGRAECWRCHQKMDPLGLVFEQYSHYGRFRLTELGSPVDTSGIIGRTGVPALDQARVGGPAELLDTLAGSSHVEQVFVRHAFRFFLGRNETTGDAKTLQDAWHSYRDSGGSFKALVTALLTSDSFLLRMP